MDLHGDGATDSTRRRRAVITPSFETVWPDVERRLRALLGRRGLDTSSADDIVQEVALRVLAHGVTYVSARDLFRWAGPVACHLHVDLLRHRARVLHDPGAAERPGTDDVAREVTHRIELQRALRGLAALRPADRAAIIDAVAEEPGVRRTRQESVRLAVRRHRARSRLALVLQQISALVTGAVLTRRLRHGVVALALVPAAALPLLGTLHPPAYGAAHLAVPAAAPLPEPRGGHPVRPAAARPVAAARPRAIRTTGHLDRPDRHQRHPLLTVAGPDGSGAEAGGEDRQPGSHVLCVGGIPPVSPICV